MSTHAEEHLREIAQRYIDGSSLATGELTKLAHGVVMMLTTIETLRGSRCAVAQGVDGIGGCGVCPSCAKDAWVRAERATLRAEKAERERDSSNEQLRIATQMLDSQRDNVADLRTRVAEVERELDEARASLDRVFDVVGMRYDDGTLYPVDDLIGAIERLRDAEPDAQIEAEELRTRVAEVERERDAYIGQLDAIARALGCVHEQSMGPDHPGSAAEVLAAIGVVKAEQDRLLADVERLRTAMPSESDLRTLRAALPLRGMSDYVRQDALRIVSRMEDAIRAHAATATKGGE